VCDQGSLVGLCMQDYKSVPPWLTSRHTPTHSHRQHSDLLIWKAQQLS